ncbi:uncharacterized protein K02A2.6-like [Argiope bruennichi]|uniref:uncharacterized protein K02A2.6-like n=1 Tax=Argiope bruennichi TaxID=94029 RepID=UPI0024940D7A|nr:uncharacterized protein K02A2.6-like [Argiope bruennichi]
MNVDLIGPIDPPSAKGHKYILCLVDQHTGWGEAIPLTSLNAKATCEALLSIFSRTGIPTVIASDNGTNFTAELTKEFEKRIGSSPRFSTPGYPQSNGLVETFNRTLKNMLHNVVREEGVSPFQLLYGRQPQGPLPILKSTWTGKFNNVPLNSTSVSKYLENLKSELEKAAEQAKLVSAVQQENAAYYHNLKSSNRVYKVGYQKKPHCNSVPIAYRKKVERQVQELLELDLIEPSVSEIAHPIVCVAKTASSMRMCIDFRALNAVTKVPVFPMKDLQELQGQAIG